MLFDDLHCVANVVSVSVSDQHNIHVLHFFLRRRDTRDCS